LKNFKTKEDLVSSKICKNTNYEISAYEDSPCDCIIATKSRQHSDFGSVFIFSADETTPTDLMKSLCLNKIQKVSFSILKQKVPVRLVRNESLDTEYSPKSFYRYDGLYWVTDFWKEKNLKSFYFKFRLIRLPAQESIPKRNVFENKNVKFDPKKLEKYLAYQEEEEEPNSIQQIPPVTFSKQTPKPKEVKQIQKKKEIPVSTKTNKTKQVPEKPKEVIKQKIVEKKKIPPPKPIQRVFEDEVYSDEEEELDGFIDDSEINNNPALLSQMIQTIMGKRKRETHYDSEEDEEDVDDGPMTQADIDREEERLLKLAKLEDKKLLEKDEQRRLERLERLKKNKKRKVL
jgi:hypothetical protein